MSDPNHSNTELPITWNDVLKPEQASPPADRPDPFAEFEIPDLSARASFSPRLAEFLAAQSLLIYYAREPRRSVWSRLGLRETLNTDDAHTHCSLVEPEPGSDRDFALVVFRGTTHFRHWLTNLQSIPRPWPEGGHVHGGFADAHEEIWQRLCPRLDQLVTAGSPLLITGHSLGAALATLTLSRLWHRHGSDLDACGYTFGSPRVGNTPFASGLEDARLYRIVRNDDLVTRFPLPFRPSRRLTFHHAGDAYYIDRELALHPRGRGDLPEEATSLPQLQALAADAFSAAWQNRPPSPLADHAPIGYWHALHHAADRP